MTVVIKRAKGLDTKSLIAQTQYATVAGAEKTLEQCLMLSSLAWVGQVDGKTACTWGLIPPTILSVKAYLWLLTTDLVKEHQFLFIRYSRRMMERMLTEFETIVGHVQVDAEQSIRWLKWLGATFYESDGSKRAFAIRRRGY